MPPEDATGTAAPPEAGTETGAMTVADQFQRVRTEHPDAPGLFADGAWLSFAEAGRLAERAAELLAEHGAGPGDRIIIYLDNGASLRLIEQAVLAYGMVRVALTPRLHPREVAAIAADCAARVICCAPSAAVDLAAALAETGAGSTVLPVPEDGLDWLRGQPAGLDWPTPGEDDPAMLMYTSGTTGAPKGAIVTHRAWLAQSRLVAAALPAVGPGDVVLAVAPMPHFGGSVALDFAVRGAATVPVRTFDASMVFRQIREHGVTILPLVPVMLSLLVTSVPSAGAVPGVRLVPYGGSPIRPDTLLAATDLFPGALHQFYGLAEVLAPISCLDAVDHDRHAAGMRAGSPESERILTSAGRPVDGVEVAIRDESPSAQNGHHGPAEIVVRAGTVTRGYWNRPRMTAEVLDADGWFATGDLGRIDGGGYLHVLDRIKDVIISGGFNVYPAEVERVVTAVPGVVEAAVIPVPHPKWGEAVHAIVVPRSIEDVTGRAAIERDIFRACRQNLADYKKPRSIEFVTELPRNPAGKIDRKRLKEPHWNQEEAS